MTKLYCYVDETGQDTKGAFFLVAVVLKEQEQVTLLQKKLERIEKESNKNLLKWTKSPFRVRENYLNKLTTIKVLKGAIFYSVYRNSKEYIPLVSLTVAKAILSEH